MTGIRSRKNNENLTAEKNLKPEVQILVIQLILIFVVEKKDLEKFEFTGSSQPASKSRNLCHQQIYQVAHKQQIHYGTPADLVVAKSVAIESPKTDHYRIQLETFVFYFCCIGMIKCCMICNESSRLLYLLKTLPQTP